MTSDERSEERGAPDEQRGDLTTADLAGRDHEPDDARAQEEEASSGEPASVALFDADETERFQSRWTEIQAGFVDRPREMVEQADTLVAELMQRLAAQFSNERSRLETQWDKDEDVSTEELRVALTRYRSFFERLLNA